MGAKIRLFSEQTNFFEIFSIKPEKIVTRTGIWTGDKSRQLPQNLTRHNDYFYFFSKSSEVSEKIKSWPHVTSCNRVKETKRQGRIAHHLYRFCPTAMPPFRTSWLYLVSPFTLQRYELFPYLPTNLDLFNLFSQNLP